MIVKGLRTELHRNEKTLLTLSVVEAPRSIFSISKILTNLRINQKVRKGILYTLEALEWRFMPKDTDRWLHTFNPTISLSRRWMEKPRFPPKAYIGVGHSDSGILSGTLAWQEIQSYTREEYPSEYEVNLFLDLLISQTPPPS